MIVSDEEAGFHYPGNKGNLYKGVESHDARGESLKRNQQAGYFDIAGNPREYLIEMVTQINREVYTHAPRPGTPEEVRELDRTLFDAWDEYRQTRN